MSDDEPSTVAVVLDELAELAELVGAAVGRGTVGVVAQVSALVFRSGADVVRVVDARELEAIRKSKRLGQASGAAAHAASRQNFAKRCSSCGTLETACRLSKMGDNPAAKCCPECSHPDFL